MIKTPFSFTSEHLEQAQKILKKYPTGRAASAVVPLLDLAQRQNGGWISEAVMDYIAAFLQMPLGQVKEVVAFYTMFYDRPMGRHVIQVCTTTPCCLVGSAEVLDACCRTLGVGLGERTADDFATVVEVECLGACVDGPVVQIDDDYYTHLDVDKMVHILGQLRERDEAC